MRLRLCIGLSLFMRGGDLNAASACVINYESIQSTLPGHAITEQFQLYEKPDGIEVSNCQSNGIEKLVRWM